VAGDLAQGVALLTGNQFAKALPVLERAATAAPESVAAHTQFGTALLHNDFPEKALKEAQQAVSLDPDDAPAHFLVGEVARAQGDVDRAEAAYRQAIRADRDHRMSQFRLSGLLQARGESGWADFYLARYARLTFRPFDAVVILKRIEAGDDRALATRIKRELASLNLEGV